MKEVRQNTSTSTLGEMDITCEEWSGNEIALTIVVQASDDKAA